ncbi:MarR family winged helix-turn-helix transcriptional regulator [Oleiharenicola sp. Vm1]|jgi:DNA-binding MarR family transcriptional regulator|uniref:MarR family winged helix-turn-helix transcriptional regulator n=1 Tax=Oleiharenicola sp. Vm1 TaxID=3398393 RepID=UPI001E03B2C6|nr:hypothetical protein [Candidatus Didemnitutus sp.]
MLHAMSALVSDHHIRDSLFELSRTQSAAEELKCRAILRLVDVSQAFGDELRRQLGASGLTEAGFLVLAHLIHGEPAGESPTEIGRTLPLSRQTFRDVLGRLEVSRLISREHVAGNCEHSIISATDDGRQAFQAATESALKLINLMAADLDDRESSLLDLTCIRLNQQLSKLKTT